jgi:hypothetical protein
MQKAQMKKQNYIACTIAALEYKVWLSKEAAG